MNPSSDIGSASHEATADAKALSYGLPPANWHEALMNLIAARFALFQLESKHATMATARRATWIGAACGCALFAWALLLAGGVSVIARTADWPWDLVAMGAAAFHLLAGIVFVRMAQKPSEGAAFPATRAEFQKDREWIENFQKTKKSND